jgi:uncharacterized protein (UPF0332 family)
MKNRLLWCAQAKNGIVLIEPNDNLASAYIRKSEDAMVAMHSVPSRDWKITAGYYSLYFSLYSVLTKIGIKSENHVCTIEIMQHLLTAFFSTEECEMLEKARRVRVETQYYVTSDSSSVFSDTLVKQVPRFLVKCKTMIGGLDEKQVHALRATLAQLIRESGNNP